jgi:hypothetical protein
MGKRVRVGGARCAVQQLPHAQAHVLRRGAVDAVVHYQVRAQANMRVCTQKEHCVVCAWCKTRGVVRDRMSARCA